MRTFKVKYNYVSPLLMKSLKGIDPLNPLVKESSAISKTHHSKKTDAMRERQLEIDYLLGAYYDEDIGMYLPAEMIEANIRAGATARKNGKNVQIAIFVKEEMIPLIHDGPKEIEELYKLEEFRDIRAVTVNKAKINRARPRFNRWSIEFHIDLNDEFLSPEDLANAIEIGGAQKGLGDYRPRYGRFTSSIKEVK